jgi:uncharacterized protein YqjF (DUF2071 family)
MFQSWRYLLFLHWPVPAAALQALLPEGLTVDTFDGQAYMGLVPFTMRGVRPVWSPSIPGISNFHEVNVRTYVHRNGQHPGVWFFSLDASNRLAVSIARRRWNLPYFNAAMRLQIEGGRIHYLSVRRGGWGGDSSARTAAVYRPTGSPSPAQPGTLEHFLVERYLLYSTSGGRLWRGQVHHTAYPVQSADLESSDDTLIDSAGILLPESVRRAGPLVHYAHGVDVEIFPLHAVD